MIKFINQFKVALSASVAIVDSTITLTDAGSLVFDQTGDYYLLTLIQSGNNNFEVVRATGKSGNNVTVIRGQEGSPVLGFSSGDSVENRLTAGACMGFVEPVGLIQPWVPGHFTDASNGGFVLGLGIATNDVAGANAYLASTAYRVADGSIPNLTHSPIWNDGVKRLPNLTDDRFIQGSSIAGGIGGSNTMLDHTHSHSLSINASGAHGHTITINGVECYVNATSGTGANSWAANSLRYGGTRVLMDEPSHTHSNSDFAGTIGTGSAATATDNRPKFLKVFYIIKVI